MELEGIKGNFDAIYSLGHNCLPGVQMAKNGLRHYAGVIDWMGSPLLSGVSNLLRNRFAHFMELRNMSITGIDPNAGCYLVRDAAYHIISNHDFSLETNTPSQILTYPQFREKIDRRIARFHEKLQTSSRMLFIRTEASLTEAQELQEVIRGLRPHGDFRILVVNHAPVQGITELHWPLERVCAVQIPQAADLFYENDELWRSLLSGVVHV